MAAAIAAVCNAVPAAAADCGQRFDEALAAPADPATAELSCSRDPASPRHCIALDGAADTIGAAAGTYALWLRLATDARSTTLRIGLDDGPAAPWYAPPTSGGWQLVTEADGRRARAFELNDGRRLRVAPRDDPRAAVDCALFVRDSEFVPGMRAIHRIGNAWAGVGVLFDGVADERQLYVGYYAADRSLAVAAFDRAARRWTRRSLPSTFAGWDNHNAIALALDPGGVLHVAGNMHATPLVYARADAPGRLDGLERLRPMTGADEDRATYPTFLRHGGTLAFLYRDGVSGAGRILLNRYAAGTWQRLTPQPLFADGDGEGGASAYPAPPRRGPDGTWHFAWAWRRTADASTTVEVGYARSADLVRWSDAAGAPLALPIRPGDGAVDRVPPGGGLSNAVTVGLDHAGAPVVSFLKYDADGHTQLHNARPRGDGWQVVATTAWRDRWTLAGHGTIPALIRAGPVRAAADGTLRQPVRHWRAGMFELVLDPVTLRALREAPHPRPLPAALLRPVLPHAGYGTIAIAAHAPDGTTAPFVLRWEAQHGGRDRRPDCTAERPVACDPPPAPLTLYEALP
ncbi:MAG: BNR repeat-containing protein [Rhodospirillales bacterium]